VIRDTAARALPAACILALTRRTWPPAYRVAGNRGELLPQARTFFNNTSSHEAVLRRPSTAPPFLTETVGGSGWSASHPCRFTHGVRGWVCLKAGLDAVKRRKISSRCWQSNCNSSAVQFVDYRNADWAIPVPTSIDINIVIMSGSNLFKILI
jgi:hypothetical protein